MKNNWLTDAIQLLIILHLLIAYTYFTNMELNCKDFKHEISLKNLSVLPKTNQVIGLHTIIRDINTSGRDFVFYADRLIRLAIDYALNFLPFEPKTVITPTGEEYKGVSWSKGICGVSIMRAGESMESGLRAVALGIKIGKILIQRDEETAIPHYYYDKLPKDIANRWVVLMDPMLATGGSAICAIDLLRKKGVPENKIIMVSLIAAPEGIIALASKYPDIRIVTTEIDRELNGVKYILPGIGDFGDRYFGTV